MAKSFGATVDAKEVGLDATRLKSIDEHFNRYVDEGRLAGYAVAVRDTAKLHILACMATKTLKLVRRLLTTRSIASIQ